MLISKTDYDNNVVSCMKNIRSLMESLHLDKFEAEIIRHIISFEDVNVIADQIIKQYILDSGVKPQCFPKISVNVAPQASGKSSLNDYSVKKLNQNCVLINSDELKKFYPGAKSISQSQFAPLYSYITDLGSNLWTSTLLNMSLQQNLNIVFEGTGKSPRILDTLSPYKEKYLIKFRTISVASTTSLSSILVRYMDQRKQNGCARLVRACDFMDSYTNVTHLLNMCENAGYVVEVFARSNNPSKLPVKVYNTHDRRGYRNAIEAVEHTRKHDAEMHADDNLEKILEVKEYLTESENVKVMAEALDIFYNLIVLQSSSYSDYNDF